MQASLVDLCPSVSICGLNGCYDDNGNMPALSLSKGTSMTNPGPVVTTYGYDYENRLTSVDSEAGYEAAYTYAADGLRLRVQESNAQYTDRWLQYDGVRPVLEGTLSGDTFTTNNRYVLEGDSYYDPLIFASIGGNSRYYLYDGLGSTRQLLDSDQAVTDTYQYEAFGNLMAGTGTTDNPYRYVGSLGYYQTSSSLMHLGARYYMPEIGRFVGKDEYVQAGHNYWYAGNSPLGFVDPMGLDPVICRYLGRFTKEDYWTSRLILGGRCVIRGQWGRWARVLKTHHIVTADKYKCERRCNGRVVETWIDWRNTLEKTWDVLSDRFCIPLEPPRPPWLPPDKQLT